MRWDYLPVKTPVTDLDNLRLRAIKICKKYRDKDNFLAAQAANYMFRPMTKETCSKIIEIYELQIKPRIVSE